MPVSIVLSNPQSLKTLKTQLEVENVLCKSRKIVKRPNGDFIIYTTVDQHNLSPLIREALYSIDHTLEIYELPSLSPTRFASTSASTSSIDSCLRKYCMQNSIAESVYQQLAEYLPKKWSVYPPMILFSSNTFENSIWEKYSEFFPFLVSEMFKNSGPATITHLAVNKPIIESDVMRRPFNLVPVHGEFGPSTTDQLFEDPSASDFAEAFWCSAVQNSITQIWAPKYTMFSRGNIKEKKRVLDTFPITKGDVVIDMYSGIGYFTFSYLKKGAIVFCWELNKWSIEGLQRGMAANKFKFKVVTKDEVFSANEYNRCLGEGITAFIFNESNECSTERFEQLNICELPIRHINLGLLPSSKDSWSISSGLIQKYSTCNDSYIHVHENVSIHDFENFTKETLEYFKESGPTEFVHLEKVKTFAPDIWHIVVDYKHTRK